MSLIVVTSPTLAEVVPRWLALRDHARKAYERTMVGGLIIDFTNDELRLLADSYLGIGEVATLRRLGLLGPDEGFDGRRGRNDGDPS